MFKNIKNLLRTLFSKPIDILTEDDRAKERARCIAQTAATGMIAKVINVMSGLITVPITLPYLGGELFGVWMTLTGFMAFLVFSDLGLSIGLKSTLAKCNGEGNQAKAKSYISTTFILLTIIAMALVILAFTAVANAELHTLIKLNNAENQQQLQRAATMLLLVFAVGMPSAVIHRTLEAYQLGAIANTAVAIGRLLSLISIFICVTTKQPLSVMASLYMGLPLLSMYICGVWLFTSRKWTRPKITHYHHGCAKEIFSIGRLALSAQLGASVMSTGPLLVLSSVFGAAAVTPYAITKRMFDAVTMVLSELLYPLWPAYGEALVRNDHSWIKQTFKKSIIISMAVFIPIFIVLSFIGQEVILLWSNDESAVPSWSLLMICNVWTFLLLVVRILSMFLNGINEFKGQAIYGLALPCLALLLGWLFADSMTMTFSIFVMIFVGEFIRILFMSWESKRIMQRFNKSTVTI